VTSDGPDLVITSWGGQKGAGILGLGGLWFFGKRRLGVTIKREEDRVGTHRQSQYRKPSASSPVHVPRERKENLVPSSKEKGEESQKREAIDGPEGLSLPVTPRNCTEEY